MFFKDGKPLNVKKLFVYYILNLDDLLINGQY